MKKLIFIFALIWICASIFSQGKDSTYYVFSKVLFIPDASTISHSQGVITYKKIYMYVDGKEVLNEKGGNTFNSETEGINYLAKQGWEVISTQKVIISGMTLNEWLLKKRVKLQSKQN